MFDQRGVVSLIKNRVKSDGIKEWICNEFCIRGMIKKKERKKEKWNKLWGAGNNVSPLKSGNNQWNIKDEAEMKSRVRGNIKHEEFKYLKQEW